MVKQKTDDAEQITRDDFPLNAIESDIRLWREQVMFQSGIIILKGFSLGFSRFDDNEARM